MLDNLEDNVFNKIMAFAHLTDRTCGLKHSKEDSAKEHPAIDYLCQNIGNKVTGEYVEQLQIPVCEECVNALSDENWILVYCLECNNSQWIYRPKAKKNYPEGNLVYWLNECPHCIEVKDKYKKEK